MYSAIFHSNIFEQSLNVSTLPQDWKFGKVVPLYKSVNKHSPINYRPISLISTSCKIMVDIIYSHLVNFLDAYSFFTPSQHYFRKFLSYETQHLSFTNYLPSILDRGLACFLISPNYSKRFLTSF